jgi:hypothetical protein
MVVTAEAVERNMRGLVDALAEAFGRESAK